LNPSQEAFERPIRKIDMEMPTVFAITDDEIDLNELLAKITLATTGAAAIFTGMVRGVTSREPVHETRYLEYEAYVPMAEAKMQQVAAEILQKWPTVDGIAICSASGGSIRRRRRC
jgi:molybdopterin synthase catalytic subunit